jgi:hypothetical protein
VDEINKTYSWKDFTGCNFSTNDPKEWVGEIVGSCFAQENGMKEVFPPDIQDVHFRRCNLDNCIIPKGATIETEGWEACCNRNHAVQNDGEAWIIDAKGKPASPLNLKSFIQDKKSINPDDIPKEFIREEEMTKNDYDMYFGKCTKKHLWFRGTPEIIKTRTEMTTSQLKAANVDLATHFDKKPEVVGIKAKASAELIKVEQADDGSFKPVFGAEEVTDYVTLKGEVTYLTVRGPAWLYAGQESDEAAKKEKELITEDVNRGI